MHGLQPGHLRLAARQHFALDANRLTGLQRLEEVLFFRDVPESDVAAVGIYSKTR